MVFTASPLGNQTDGSRTRHSRGRCSRHSEWHLIVFLFLRPLKRGFEYVLLGVGQVSRLWPGGFWPLSSRPRLLRGQQFPLLDDLTVLGRPMLLQPLTWPDSVPAFPVEVYLARWAVLATILRAGVRFLTLLSRQDRLAPSHVVLALTLVLHHSQAVAVTRTVLL